MWSAKRYGIVTGRQKPPRGGVTYMQIIFPERDHNVPDDQLEVVEHPAYGKPSEGDKDLWFSMLDIKDGHRAIVWGTDKATHGTLVGTQQETRTKGVGVGAW